jgi:D-galactarolactone cycloisomerase
LKIKDIRVKIISVPLEKPFMFAQGWVSRRSSVIVEVEGVDGTVGYGECLCHGQQPPQIAAAIIENSFINDVIGMDSFDAEVIWETLYNKTRPFGQQGSVVNALSGLDIAIWDLKGKELGQPICKLLGGKFREKIQAYATGFYRVATGKYPQDLVEEAKSYVKAGFKGMKLKAGFGIEEDILLVKEVRAAVGDDIRLMVDFNASYNQAEARRIMLELQKEKVHFFEEPLPPEDIKGYKALRNLTSSYVAAGENMFGKISIKNWLEAGALDIYQPDLCSAGGFTEMKKMSSLTEAYNTQLSPHVWGSGIGLAASLQYVANLVPTPISKFPTEIMLEFDQSSHPFRLALINDGIEFIDGFIMVPDKPGIGVDVNTAILEKFKIN